MADIPISKPGPVIQQPGLSAAITPIPTINDYDLDALFPPIIDNSPLPDPDTLNSVVNKPRELTLRGARRGDPEPYIFGRCLADPDLIAADDAGDFLIMDWLWSVGECDYIEGMYVDGVNEGRADMLGKMQHFEGTPAQGVSSIMDDQKGGDYDVLNSKCHSVVSWRYEWSLQVQGAIRGLKLYDPREDDEVYSTNPALALARILVDTGYTVNWDSVADAADYCDEVFDESEDPEALRWSIGGQVRTRASAREWIETFAAYASCFVDRLGGEVYLIPNKPREPNHTVNTVDDAVTGSVRAHRPGGQDVPETVTVVGRAFEGHEVSYTYGTPGGAGTHSQLPMPFFQTVHACGRKAEEVWRQARTGVTLEFIGFDIGITHTLGDVAVVTSEECGIIEMTMALIQNKQLTNGRWHKKYMQYADENYSDEFYTSDENLTSLQDPTFPPQGPTPTVAEEVFTPYAVAWNPSYNSSNRFRVTWLGETWPYIKDYRVTIETEDGVIQQDQYVPHIPKSGDPEEEQEHTLLSNFPLVEGELYTVKIYVRSKAGEVGEEPGVVYIVAAVLFYSAAEGSFGGDVDWIDYGYAIIDDGSDSVYTYAEWQYDYSNLSEHLEFTYSLADNGVPDDANITGIHVFIRHSELPIYTPLNLLVSLVATTPDPDVVGNVKEINLNDAFYDSFGTATLSGDLTYWGLTNEEVMELFDDSGNGILRLQGEAEDTLEIPDPSGAQRIYINWAKVGVSYTLP